MRRTSTAMRVHTWSTAKNETHRLHAGEFCCFLRKGAQVTIFMIVFQAPFGRRPAMINSVIPLSLLSLCPALLAFARCLKELVEFSSGRPRRPWSWSETQNVVFTCDAFLSGQLNHEVWRLLGPFRLGDARNWPSGWGRWSGSRCWAASRSSARQGSSSSHRSRTWRVLENRGTINIESFCGELSPARRKITTWAKKHRVRLSGRPHSRPPDTSTNTSGSGRLSHSHASIRVGPSAVGSVCHNRFRCPRPAFTRPFPSDIASTRESHEGCVCCNNSIYKFEEHVNSDTRFRASQWALSGPYSVCHCLEKESCHGNKTFLQFQLHCPDPFDRNDCNQPFCLFITENQLFNTFLDTPAAP